MRHQKSDSPLTLEISSALPDPSTRSAKAEELRRAEDPAENDLGEGVEDPLEDNDRVGQVVWAADPHITILSLVFLALNTA